MREYTKDLNGTATIEADRNEGMCLWCPKYMHKKVRHCVPYYLSQKTMVL
jgi:hypothetical protein